jgi:hypothetical protein
MPSTQSPTTVPTSALVEGWLLYQNDLLGYEFSYPPQAQLSSAGPDGYSPDDVPPGITLGYLALLESIYPDDLCVGVGYATGFVIIKAPLNQGGKFVTCGVTGVGDVDLIQKSETIIIAGQSYAATGYEVRDRYADATFREFFFTSLEDGTRIEYGGSGATYDSYLPVKQTLQQILASYRKFLLTPSCGSNWTQLYPGIFAVVAGEPGDPPNHVRSAPSTDASVITQIDPGEFVLVMEGPTCVNNLVFWKVRSDAIPGGVGWTGEGDGAKYYLVPYHP